MNRWTIRISRLALGALLTAGLAGAGIVASSVGSGLASAAVTGASCPAGWPMYQHDAGHTAQGCSSLSPTSVTTLHPAWFASTPGAVSAEPTVADNTVFVGDSTGLFHAVSQTTGASEWTFSAASPQSCYLDQPNPYTDQHSPGFGSITSSASFASSVHADARYPDDPTLYFGGGGSLFAVDALTGTCDWAQDIDPASPANSMEIESSPVVDTSVSPPEVIVGSDDNSSAGINVSGVQAFNATTGALLWRYEPERDVTLYPSQFGGSDALTLSCGDGTANANCNPTAIPGVGLNSATWADACGDVWSSPVLDPTYVDPAGRNSYQSVGPQATVDPVWQPKRITARGRPSRDGLVVFGTGNCAADPSPATTYAHDDYAHAEGDFAIDPVTGVRVWNWFEPANLYNTDNPNEQGGGDDDFGSSAIVASVPDSEFAPGSDPCPSVGASVGPGTRRANPPETSTATTMVIQGGKSGFVYGLCESTGQEVWSVQAVEPGELGESLVGSLGGFIGSPSLGQANGRLTAFFDAAVPLPFAADGIRQPGSADDAGATCPDLAVPGLPLLPACADPSLATNPQRLLAVQAVDVATGNIVWRALAGPSYATTTYSNGVVFVPSTTEFSAVAYDADNGLPLWHFPLGAVPASGASITGQGIFLGTGISEGEVDSTTVPPGANGIWSFSLGATVPTVSGLP
jgi:outer membrane protein assembly factor BamB